MAYDTFYSLFPHSSQEGKTRSTPPSFSHLGSMPLNHPTSPRCNGSIYAWFHHSLTIVSLSPCVEKRRNWSSNWRRNSLQMLVKAKTISTPIATLIALWKGKLIIPTHAITMMTSGRWRTCTILFNWACLFIIGKIRSMPPARLLPPPPPLPLLPPLPLPHPTLQIPPYHHLHLLW